VDIQAEFDKYLESQTTKTGDELRQATKQTYKAIINPLESTLQKPLQEEDLEGVIDVLNKSLEENGDSLKRATYTHFLSMLGLERDEARDLLVEVNDGEMSPERLAELTLSYEELNRLVARTDDDWDMFLISFLYDTALRQGTARKLCLDDIITVEDDAVNDERQDEYEELGVAAVIDVVRKGGKNGRVYITEETLDILMSLIEKGRWDRYEKPGEAPLIRFFKDNGEPYVNQSSQFSKHFKRLTEDKLNMEDGYTPHAMRHTAITHMVDNEDMNPRDVQQYAGHSNFETTQRYILASERFNKRAIEKHKSVSEI